MLDRRGMGGIVRSAFAAALAEREVSPGYYLVLGRQAMACQFQIFLRPRDGSFVPAVHEALNEIDRLERQMTVYRDDSEICLLNRTAFACPVPVEERLYGLLRRAHEIGRQTQGAFDITAGPLIRCWGFLERKGRIPGEEELDSARAVTGWDKVLFDDENHSVRFLGSGVELNLGSIGKGYALDRAAELLRSAGLNDFMIHAGHSSIYASGNSNLGPGWEVSIRAPHEPGASLGTIRLVDEGMSTSGTGQQYFVVVGRKFGHLLDPRTGWPSTHNSLCSVTAPGAAQAEALSTAFFVMTPEAVRAYCDSHPEVGSILVAAHENAAVLVWGLSLKTGSDPEN